MEGGASLGIDDYANHQKQKPHGKSFSLSVLLSLRAGHERLMKSETSERLFRLDFVSSEIFNAPTSLTGFTFKTGRFLVPNNFERIIFRFFSSINLRHQSSHRNGYGDLCL